MILINGRKTRNIVNREAITPAVGPLFARVFVILPFVANER